MQETVIPYEEDGKHEEVSELIPWYVNQTLEANERTRVEKHLSMCHVCKQELARFKLVNDALKQVPAEDLWTPTAQSFTQLLDSISAMEKTTPQQKKKQQPEQKSWLGNWWESFYEITKPAQWIIATQTALLLLFCGLFLFRAIPGQEYFQTYTSSKATSQEKTTQLNLVFSERIMEKDWRELLHQHQLRIIDGPTDLGVYTLSTAKKLNTQQAQQELLNSLRSNQRVRFAELVSQ